MALETASYIDGLVATNPTGADSRTTADDHLRLIKAALKRTFPNVAGAVNPTHTELNYVDGLTSTAQDQLNTLKTGKLNISATAVYAQSAGGATSAQFATSATNATSAVFATSATNATSAVFATSATRATSAVQATNATNASSAAYAFSATNATSADRATTAVYSISAGDYNGAVSAGQIPNASVGGQGVVEFATTAEYAAGSDLTRIISVGTFGAPRSLLADYGYYVFPGGLTFQWGSNSCPANQNTNIVYGRNFTNVWNVHVTSVNTTDSSDNADQVNTVGTNSFNIFNGYGSTLEFYWLAIGLS